MADIIIADHARKDIPAGSVSWKFIEESVKAGELKDIEDYRCGASANTSRQRRSNQPNKSSRNPFTQQEDHILTQWVTKAARRGLATKGNDIYLQLEELVRLLLPLVLRNAKTPAVSTAYCAVLARSVGEATPSQTSGRLSVGRAR
jgi:hypothetical protein